MSLTITAEQRDALYDQILIRLSGIDGVWLALRAGELETAERLAREYSDALRLLLDGLGFGEGSGESVELTSSPDVLRRVLERLSRLAEGHGATEDEAREQAERAVEQSRLTLKTCSSLLAALDADIGRD
ncbi:MAG: hypothetical protein ACOYD4_08575 [Solirubrobacterales bacterium]